MAPKLKSFSDVARILTLEGLQPSPERDVWEEPLRSRGIGISALEALATAAAGAPTRAVWNDEAKSFVAQCRLGGSGVKTELVFVPGGDRAFPSPPTQDDLNQPLQVLLCQGVPLGMRRDVFGSSDAGRTGAFHQVPIYPGEVESLLRRDYTFTELLSTKLVRLVDGEWTAWRELWVLPTSEEIRHLRLLRRNPTSDRLPDAEVSSEIDHPAAGRVAAWLGDSRWVAVAGPSASGKSILLRQVNRLLASRGFDTYSLDFSANPTCPLDLVERILAGDRLPDAVMIDDAQSNAAGSRTLLAALLLLKDSSAGLQRYPVACVVGWPSIIRDLSAEFGPLEVVSVAAHDVAHRLVRSHLPALDADSQDAVVERAHGNLVILERLLRLGTFDDSWELGSTLERAAHELWDSIVSVISTAAIGAADEAERVVLLAAALGRRDLAIKPDALRLVAAASHATVEALITVGVLRRDREYVRLGHRALCALLSDYANIIGAWVKWLDVLGRDDTEAVARYIEVLPPSDAIESLRSIATKADVRPGQVLNERGNALLRTWQSFRRLTERVELQEQTDATWGATPSSCMFVCQAFSELGQHEKAEPSLRFLREHWSIEASGELTVRYGAFSTVADFGEIRRCMAEQDRSIRPELAGWSPVESIDVDRFHSTWLAGVVLSAEAAMNGHRRHALAEAIGKLQAASGAFYPDRVPWSTARVLLGLGAAGHTVDSSDVCEAGARWLMRSREDGGARMDGIWRSGTGSWNSTLETTAMVLVALAEVGVDCTDRELRHARRFVENERSEWSVPGRELDAALAIRALLATGTPWEDVATEANALAERCLGDAIWGVATTAASESLRQSCNAAQVAADLVFIGWNGLKGDLPLFLRAFEDQVEYRHDMVGRGDR